MDDIILKIIIVSLLAMSPVGELLIAYPIGIALGLDSLTSIIVSLFFNIMPIPFLLILFEKLINRFPRFANIFIRRSVFYKKYIHKFNLIIFLIFTPIFGVYATNFAMKALNFKNKISFIVQLISLFIYSLIIYYGFSIIFDFLLLK